MNNILPHSCLVLVVAPQTHPLPQEILRSKVLLFKNLAGKWAYKNFKHAHKVGKYGQQVHKIHIHMHIQISKFCAKSAKCCAAKRR